MIRFCALGLLMLAVIAWTELNHCYGQCANGQCSPSVKFRLTPAPLVGSPSVVSSTTVVNAYPTVSYSTVKVARRRVIFRRR